VRFDSRKPARQRIVDIRRPDGSVVRDGDTYVLGLSDFLQTGGEGMTMLVPLTPRRTGKTDLEALIAYLERAPQPVRVSAAPRFIDVAP
jgi:2',3'-cyclic-nucleotide 2'-phosphodiesterase (5'-nucleotidase family)